MYYPFLQLLLEDYKICTAVQEWAGYCNTLEELSGTQRA